MNSTIIIVTFYWLLHFTVVTIAMWILEIRGGQNIFWPANAVLASGLINQEQKGVKVALVITCSIVQTVSYCAIFRKEFFWIPINVSESLSVGIITPILLKMRTGQTNFNLHHVNHLLILFMVIVVSCAINSLIGALALYTKLSYVGTDLVIATISWFLDNMLGAMIAIPFLCTCDWWELWAEIRYPNRKTYIFWSKWVVSIILISSSFMKYINVEGIDALRIIMSIPLLMLVTACSYEGLALFLICITTTINAYLNDYGSEVQRSWSRFYVFWSIVVNISFIGIFHSRKKLISSIERQVQTRTNELNELRENAIASSVQKAEFISYMSHEIRNPVHAIGNMVECIASTSGLPTEVEPYIENLRTSNNFILDLVTNILDIGKLEADKFTVNITPTKIIPILNTFIGHSELQCRSHGIRLIFQKGFRDFPQLIDIDGVKFQQILYNLMSNAIKYTHLNGTIEITFAYINDEIQFIIQDSGVGIPKETLEHLFEPYVQAVSAKSGTGLGLAICKAFAEKLSGVITVESVVSEGSKFTVSIPARPSVVVLETHADNLIHKPQGSNRVLVVDDEAVNRKILKRMLYQMGFQVHEAVNGQDAIHVYQNCKPFAFVISDLHMPIMGGIELREKINDDVQFIIVSADEIQPTKQFSILRKPFKFEDLVAKLNTINQIPHV